MDLNESGKVTRNLLDPPLKDTVSVPDGGFTLIRFHADNPGYWLLHCHMSWHNHVGMAVILQVFIIRVEATRFYLLEIDICH